jgi:D-serine deaminase-like pyridoxal phosphate-dependent protein
MKTLAECATPALVLDRDKLQINAKRMLDQCHRRGTRLRPHMKTLKSIEAARYCIDPQHGGIAVSTLREAEYFAALGITDIQLAVCLPPDKLLRAVRVPSRKFSFFVDSIATARALAALAASDRHWNIWIEIDCGEHRTGVAPDDPLLLEIAHCLSSVRNLSIEGVATHAGQAYAVHEPAAHARIAEVERAVLLEARQRLLRGGCDVRGASAGSTPTAAHGENFDGLTELRAGVYMVGDLFQAAIGTVPMADVALSVLATVISHNRRSNQIVIDAGGLALSKDRSTAELRDGDGGYGIVADIEGQLSFGRMSVRDVHQEHGEIRSATPLPFERLPVGSRVRIFPNHACMTAAMYDSYWVVAGGAGVVDRWSRVNGWSSPTVEQAMESA